MIATASSKPDAVTKRWIRNTADEKAVRAGCRFDEARGQEVVDWIQDFCRLYEGERAGQKMELGDWQYEVTMRLFGWTWMSPDWGRWVRRFRKGSVWIPKKNGKALALDTPIPTPTGWKNLGDLEPGDAVFSENGGVCRVTHVHPILIDESTYKVSFGNGEQVVCNGEHLWETNALQQTVGTHGRGKAFAGNQYASTTAVRFTAKAVRTTSDIAASLRRRDGACNHSLLMPAPLTLPSRQLPIDPYVFGCWLGDGDSDCARITCHHDDFAVYESEFAKAGYRIAHRATNSTGAVRFRFQGESSSPVRTTLKRMGVFRDKHIPQEYLRASIPQRVALLQGLMDTDGAISKSGKGLTYTTKVRRLADGVCELLSSLGIKHRVATKCPVIAGTRRAYHTIQFHAFRGDLPSFRLPRKLERMRCVDPLKSSARSRTVQITDITKVAPVPVRCITVDNPSGLFLCGRTMLPTHNSPTLAAWGLYLFCGDGEPGQKVYSVAKDGGQAMISFRHAIEMVKASEELREACEIKLGGREGPRIIHPESRSIYRIVAGDNPNSQEGLNGSVLVDETHVVDRRLMRILKGAGISRSEPIQIEVSTAGNNPDGYGKSQFDYGEKVNSGEVDDVTFFYQAYAAPQTITDSDLGNDIEAIGKAANPTWGRIVRSAEFLAEYKKAKLVPSDLLDFKMYRLNIWQSSSNPFLPAGAWAACRDEFSEKDLEGRRCYAGFDLSLKWDTTALALLFPWEMDGEHQAYRLLTYFWLPQETANKQRELVSWHNWSSAGAITLTHGNITDFPLVKRFILDCNRRFNIQSLAYDERFAQSLCQELQDDHGMKVVPFGQGPRDMGGPMETFGALVIANRIKHNGNPVMSWQAGNLAFRESNGAKKPEKPRGGLHLKIDGCVATIMAIGQAMLEPGDMSIYDREGRGFVTLG